MPKTILITGGEGQLANELRQKIDTIHNVHSPCHDDLDICNLIELTDYINKAQPDVVIHAAAMTNPMENHELFTDESIQTNIVGTANVVTACLRADSIPKLIYISTDYVYKSGAYLIGEDERTEPCNNYGWSKLGGEISVRMMPKERWLILRSAFTILPWKHKKAYSDSYKTLCTISQAAECIAQLIDLDANGIYNLGGKKKQSLYGYAKNTLNIPDVEPISRLTATYIVPENTAMSPNKLKSFMDLNDEII